MPPPIPTHELEHEHRPLPQERVPQSATPLGPCEKNNILYTLLLYIFKIFLLKKKYLGGGVFSLARENEPQKRKLLATKGPAREDPKSGITRIWRRESTPAGSHARVFKLMLFDAWVAPRLRSTRVKKILLRPRAASPCHHF